MVLLGVGVGGTRTVLNTTLTEKYLRYLTVSVSKGAVCIACAKRAPRLKWHGLAQNLIGDAIASVSE